MGRLSPNPVLTLPPQQRRGRLSGHLWVRLLGQCSFHCRLPPNSESGNSSGGLEQYQSGNSKYQGVPYKVG